MLLHDGYFLLVALISMNNEVLDQYEQWGSKFNSFYWIWEETFSNLFYLWEMNLRIAAGIKAAMVRVNFWRYWGLPPASLYFIRNITYMPMTCMHDYPRDFLTVSINSIKVQIFTFSNNPPATISFQISTFYHISSTFQSTISL